MSAIYSTRFVNKSELACLLDKSLFTLDAWIRKGMPFTKKGDQTTEWEFDVSEVLKWREKQAEAAISEPMEDIGIEQLKKRKLAAETALLEIELQQRRRETVLVRDAEESIAHAYITIKQRLRTIPERVVSPLMAEQDENAWRELLLNEIDDALLDLSQLDFDGTKTE